MSNKPQTRRMTSLHDASLLCKAGCGFYGNPTWQDFCSVCFKKYKNQIKLGEVTCGLKPSGSSSSPALPSQGLQRRESIRSLPCGPVDEDGFEIVPPELLCESPSSMSPYPTPKMVDRSFEKFEEKKRAQTKSFKSIFKRASTFRESSKSPNNLTGSTLPLSWKDSKLLSLDNLSFKSDISTSSSSTLRYDESFDELDSSRKLKESIDVDIRKNVRRMVDKVHRMNRTPGVLMSRSTSNGPPASVEEISESIHDFYQYMTDRFNNHEIYCGLDPDHLDNLIDMTETLLMEQLYHMLSSRILSEDETKDLFLQKRIKSLNWIMVQHLDISLNMRSPIVRDLLDKAITEIISMGSKNIPSEKLESVYICSKIICKMLSVDAKHVVSADQFLPGLVFVVIKANPPLLSSNIKFITLFSNPRRLMSGEAGYYFTNLCCATSFIEKLNHESLNMDADTFNSYVSGDSVPNGYFEQSAYLCDAFRIMFSNSSILEELSSKQKNLDSEISSLQCCMNKFKEQFDNKIESATGKPFKKSDTFYTVDDDVDIQLVPSYLRDRILFEREERRKQSVVLVEIPVVEQTSEEADEQLNPAQEIGQGDSKDPETISTSSPVPINFDSSFDDGESLPVPLIPNPVDG